VDLSDLAVVDGHCHPLLADPWAIPVERFLDLLTEGRPGTMTAHVPHTGYYRRVVGDLSRQLGCEPTAKAILERREALGPEAQTRLFAGRKVGALIVDTAYPPGAMSLEEMGRLLPCEIHEVFRIETCAEALLRKGLPYPEFLESFVQELRSAARHCVALKTIIAYRSGLAVRSWEAKDATRAYQAELSRAETGKALRLTEKPLLDTLLLSALEVARERSLPFQFHTGLGDPDIDLLQANPLLLRPLLEDPAWAELRIVLLHMAYPYFREAAFMTAVWPQVLLDLSLALPLLGPGAVPPLIEILSLAPTSKLLYGSDLGGLPELLALSADWGRAALGEALGWLVERGQYGAEEARDLGGRILADNARRLYGLSPPRQGQPA
jgi:predicted TIM-barrel fold metal-dependent hydrolase